MHDYKRTCRILKALIMNLHRKKVAAEDRLTRLEYNREATENQEFIYRGSNQHRKPGVTRSKCYSKHKGGYYKIKQEVNKTMNTLQNKTVCKVTKEQEEN